MSLEDLKKDWNSVGDSTNLSNISNDQINTILKSKYRSFINRFLIFEILILLVYLYFIVLTLYRFDELGINYLEVLAIVSIAILSLLLIMRSRRLINTYRHKFLNSSHTVVFKKLAELKIRSQRFYLINIISGFILIVILIILNIKIYNEYDLVQSNYFWLVITPGSLAFIVLVNNWIKNSYTKVVAEAEELIEELDEHKK